jgi:hypothetical protein
MTDTPGLVRPAPMEGHGAYNRSSRVQAAGSMPAMTLVERAAKEVALGPPPRSIIVVDYGCSEGRNSLVPMAAAVDILRTRIGPEQAICVIHTDLPENDFSALFHTLNTEPGSYLLRNPGVFASAVGRSFYEQILPSNSVTLGWSSWAVQWLSRAPTIIPDQVQVAFSQDQATRIAFAQQAAEDWCAFLAARSRELCSDGRLVVLTMATDDSGDFGYRPLLEALQASLLDMTSDGFVSAEEVRRMTIPTVGRSRADFAAPFVDDGSFMGLSLEHLEVFHGEDRIWTDFEASGDSRAFGVQWAAFSRASVFPTLAAALDGGRGDRRSAGFVDRLEARLAARLGAAPERMPIPLAQMSIIKGAQAR